LRVVLPSIGDLHSPITDLEHPSALVDINKIRNAWPIDIV
jgi:hypothetical protein